MKTDHVLSFYQKSIVQAAWERGLDNHPILSQKFTLKRESSMQIEDVNEPIGNPIILEDISTKLGQKLVEKAV